MRLDEFCGQYHVRRALEVAMAGQHSVLFIGSWTSQAGAFAAYAREKGLRARAVAPCPCGNYNDSPGACTCSVEMVARWQAKHLGDRVQYDIYIEVPPDDLDHIMAKVSGRKKDEPEEAVSVRLCHMKHYTDCTLRPDGAEATLLRTAIRQLQLSYTQVRTILSVARTIANLAGSERIESVHLAEAVQYRKRNGGR